ncbi:MAG: dipeptidase PepE [Bacteroidota bacterium]
MSKLLLLSNSTLPGTPFFTWPRPWVKEFLGQAPKELAFIPFAGVALSWDEYEQKVRDVFAELGYGVRSIHRASDKKKALQLSDAVLVGGGNTWALLSRMYEVDVLDTIRAMVNAGKPYIGWSAGANVACPTIMTTNDMPVVNPPSLQSLGLVPFQINPHYHELKFENQGGETRRERLEEFLLMNSDKKVIGLPEGTLLHRDGNILTIKGKGIAKIYEAGIPIKEAEAPADLSFLMS